MIANVVSMTNQEVMLQVRMMTCGQYDCHGMYPGVILTM